MNIARILATLVVVATCGSAFAQKVAAAPAPDVTTIDQTKAINGGITTGDGAGFPITISQPGSYRLMSNLVVPAGVDGIRVTASDVTIDLNGFAITGTVQCSGNTGPASIVCSSSGARGISSYASNIYRLAVRNGKVNGFYICMEARYVAMVSDVAMADCANALVAMEGSLVSRAAIHRSADAGSLYGSTVDSVQLNFVRDGFATGGSMLRSVSMNAVNKAFSLGGSTNSALSLSVINAAMMGNGVQSVGGNLCNGVAC